MFLLPQLFCANCWPEVPSRKAIAAMAALVIYIAWKMSFSGWVFPLDNFTLAIHEAGHPLVGLLLGERMTVYGGSLFQLVFPAITARHFWNTKQPLGFVFAIAWGASSMHNLGIYVADAQDQMLPLVGAGDRLHDWAEILGRWHLTGACRFLGGCLKLASLYMVFLSLWLLVEFWRNPATVDSPENTR